MTGITLFITALIATFLGVFAFRAWSLRRGLLDIPNERSSHQIPTPRGGGLLIALVTIILYSFITQFITHNFNWAYPVAAGIMALVGWLDDLYSIPILPKLFFHAAAAIILIYGFGYWTELTVPGFEVSLWTGSLGPVFAFVWIVWIINAYNFMDGIDGLAGSQAVLAGLAWCAYGYVFGYETAYYLGGVLAFSSFGFLLHNWSPARVFLGDIGSSFLGITFAAIPLMAAGEERDGPGLLLPAGAAFLWLFIFDAAFTRLGRALRGQNVLAPHREHLYQKMVLNGMSHSAVTLIYAGFSILISVSFLAWASNRGRLGYLTLLLILVLSGFLIFWATEKKIDVSIGK